MAREEQPAAVRPPVELGSLYVSSWSGRGFEVVAINDPYVVLQCATTGRQRKTLISLVDVGPEYWFVHRGSAAREKQALIDQAAPFQY